MMYQNVTKADVTQEERFDSQFVLSFLLAPHDSDWCDFSSEMIL